MNRKSSTRFVVVFVVVVVVVVVVAARPVSCFHPHSEPGPFLFAESAVGRGLLGGIFNLQLFDTKAAVAQLAARQSRRSPELGMASLFTCRKPFKSPEIYISNG